MNFEQVTNFDAIYEAYRKSKRGKGYNQSRLRFEMAAQGWIDLYTFLLRGEYGECNNK